MIINLDNTVSYLLERNLISTTSIVKGDLKLIDASRKNRNIKVLRKTNASYLLKQPNIGDRYSALTIQRESLLYKLVKGDDDMTTVRSIMPNFFDYDDKQNILCVEYVENAQSLNNYNYNLPIGDFPTYHALEMGTSMATYHNIFRKYVGDKRLSFLPKKYPPGIIVVRPGPNIFSRLSPANLKLIKIIQKYPDLLEFLEHMFDDWSIETLVHGDMKWDNIIISTSSYDNDFQMKIVDWELAEIGDPAWDIGGTLHEFIVYWLNSLPITGKENPDELIDSTDYPLHHLKNAIRSFWIGYIKMARIYGRTANDLIIKSTKYCAGRLIQKAYEYHQSAAELSNIAFYMIQVSLNIMKNIDDAIMHLFGIPLSYSLT